ncbi:hypothetical protein ONZ51_g10408 [Trametes cubensis]|uniref:GH10 domain-containing protein n=1 Tax=Trametes cubensis TaxID=1111947 RepID=A0AAD7X6E5_9APHY|nr:hypothetical protein ONZ51_g10408 [Trametes cubensis]
MILFATLLPFAAASVISRSVDRLPTQEDTSTIGLNDAAHYANKLYFGTATNYGEFNDTIQGDEMGKSLNEETEPERGVFTFEQGDQIAALARQSGKYLRGHNCVWYNRLPAWVTNTTWTAPELAEVVQEHCYNIVRHWRGQMYKPFNDDGTWRETLWYTTLGTKYISLALHAASKADPHAKLYINEYNITGTGPKATSMKKLIKDLKLAGVPIDGVGVQAHEVVGKVPNDIRKNLEEFVALGVEVAITELDVMFYTLPPDEAGLQQQRKDFETIVGACAAVERCVGVTVWDFTDKYSWIPGTFPGSGDACPWDNNLQKKPAYYGIVNGFEKKHKNNMSDTYTWLITGSSRGIGLEMTKQLLADPSNIVVATCRNPDKATGLHALKDSAKGTLHIIPLDVADEESIRNSYKLVEPLIGDKGLDYLYNNAAINEGFDTAFNFTSDRMLRTIKANLIGPAIIAQTYLPLLEKGKRKVIVNMSSGLASIGLAQGEKCATYSISKTALNMLTYKQKAERPDITAVLVDPGWVKTEMGGEGAVLEPEFSVSNVLRVVTGLTNKDSGKFFRYTGEEIPW